MQKQKLKKEVMELGFKKVSLAYKNMLDRCYNPNNASYKNYGERGIKVCAVWLKNKNSFIKWASKTGGKKTGLSLDRKNNELGYSPKNCKWSTVQQQLSNQRRNRKVTIKKITKTISEWARLNRLREDTVFRRIDVYKIPITKAFTQGRLNAWKHGTRQGYEKYKCKCMECKKANTKRHRMRRLRETSRR